MSNLLRLIAALIVCSSVVPCSAGSSILTVKAKREKADVIAQMLQVCPLWTQVPERDIKERQHITDMYLVVAQYDTATIRQGIAMYLNDRPASSPQRLDAGDTIFALLRVVFKVPRLFDVNREPVPFSLLGNPVQSEGVDLLWPYSMDENGHLVLTGIDLGAHTGPAYDPLRDFDQMATSLGRRFAVSR